MRMPLFVVAAILTGSALANAQSGTHPALSSKDVVREYIKLELDGARLAPARQEAIAPFLVHPGTTPPTPINVVSDKFDVNEVPSREDSPRLNVYFPYLYGQLDSSLRFTASIHMQRGGSLKMEGTNHEYQLVLTTVHPALESRSPEKRDATPPKQWRIEKAPQHGFVSLATAIRYLKEMSETTL